MPIFLFLLDSALKNVCKVGWKSQVSLICIDAELLKLWSPVPIENVVSDKLESILSLWNVWPLTNFDIYVGKWYWSIKRIVQEV